MSLFGKLLGTLLFLPGMASAAAGQSATYRRVIVLNSAASPILKELGVADHISGTTHTDHVFQGVTRVGSHLRPNLELIKALRPDLMIVGSKKAFPEEMQERLKVEIFRYDPRNLEDILAVIARLGHLFGQEEKGLRLVASLRTKMALVRWPKKPVTMIYEISEKALKVAGRLNVVNDIIKTAGGINLIDIEKKHVLISPEKVLELEPDVYLFQEGPMNKNPEDPSARSYFKSLKSKVVKVDQLEFSRSGINAFDAVLKLNKLILNLNSKEPNG